MNKPQLQSTQGTIIFLLFVNVDSVLLSIRQTIQSIIYSYTVDRATVFMCLWGKPAKPLTSQSEMLHFFSVVRGPHANVQAARLKACGVDSVADFATPDAKPRLQSGIGATENEQRYRSCRSARGTQRFNLYL
jgi:hypothetical protein